MNRMALYLYVNVDQMVSREDYITLKTTEGCPRRIHIPIEIVNHSFSYGNVGYNLNSILPKLRKRFRKTCYLLKDIHIKENIVSAGTVVPVNYNYVNVRHKRHPWG